LGAREKQVKRSLAVSVAAAAVVIKPKWKLQQKSSVWPPKSGLISEHSIAWGNVLPHNPVVSLLAPTESDHSFISGKGSQSAHHRETVPLAVMVSEQLTARSITSLPMQKYPAGIFSLENSANWFSCASCGCAQPRRAL